MEFFIENEIIIKIRRLLFIIIAVACIFLIYFKMYQLCIAVIVVFICVKIIVVKYFKSWNLKITEKNIILKKGIFFKLEYYIPRSRAVQVYKYKTAVDFFKINFLVIKGTGFYLCLIPCSEKVCKEILSRLL